MAGVFGDGYRRRVGEFVRRADDEAVEGVAVHLGRYLRHVVPLLLHLQLLGGEHDEIHVAGEDLPQRGAYHLAEAAGYYAPLEVGGGLYDHVRLPQLHRRAVRKPGVVGRGRDVLGDLCEDALPHGIQRVHLFPPQKNAPSREGRILI